MSPLLRVPLLLLLCLSTSACYYLQAARGQLSLLFNREPIAELLQEGEARRVYLQMPFAAPSRGR